MTRRRAPLATGLAVALAVAALGLWELASAEPAAAAAPVDLRWPRGLALRFELRLAGHTEVPAPAGPGTLGGRMRCGGVLAVRRLDGDEPRLSLRLERFDEAEMTLLGQPAMQDLDALREALVGPEAVVTLHPGGDVRGLAFTPGAHHLFQSLVMVVLGELQWAEREGDAWTLVETTPRGVAEAAWARTALGLERRRPRYHRVTGFGPVEAVSAEARAAFTFTPGGPLATLSASETLRGLPPAEAAVSHLELELRQIAVTPEAPAPAPVAAAVRLGELPRPADAREQVLRQRAAGLTAEGLLEGLERFAAAPRAEGLPAFVAQASGLLRLHPELCQALAAQVLSPSGPVRTRHFALELLAAAGSPEAQAAMRQVLEATGDARGAQRLSLLQRPTAETVRFVEAWWRSAAGPDRAPLALTLGATAGLLAHGGEAGAAAPALDALAAALASAQAPDDRRTQLLALGNAGAEAAVPAVLAHAADADPAVREAALEALRKTLTPAARAALQAALADPSDLVARRAVAVFAGAVTTVDDRRALMTAVRGGTLRLDALPLVLDALEPHLRDDATVRPFLAWLAGAPEVDPSVRRRLSGLLEQDVD